MRPLSSASCGNLRGSMAEIQPLRAVHYDTATAGPLDRLTAPPYDVIDPALRGELVVAQPSQRGRDRPPGGRRPLPPRRRALGAAGRWRGSCGGTPSLRCGRSSRPTRAPGGGRHTRRGFFCRVRVTDYGPGLIRPHERTHPAAKQDRLELMRATRANLSPIFSLYRRPRGGRLERARPRARRASRGER